MIKKTPDSISRLRQETRFKIEETKTYINRVEQELAANPYDLEKIKILKILKEDLKLLFKKMSEYGRLGWPSYTAKVKDYMRGEFPHGYPKRKVNGTNKRKTPNS